MKNIILYGIFTRLKAKGIPLGTRDYLDGLQSIQIYQDNFFDLQNTIKNSRHQQLEDISIAISQERLALVWLFQTLWARNKREKDIIHEVITQTINVPDNRLTHNLIEVINRRTTDTSIHYNFKEPLAKFPFKEDNQTKEDNQSSTDIIDKPTPQKEHTTSKVGINVINDNDPKNSDYNTAHISLPILADQFIQGRYMMYQTSPISEIWLLSLWRRLLRPVKVIDRSQIDVPKTISQLARTGCLVKPAMAQKTVNSIKLKILIDISQNMSPWKHIEKLLIKSLTSKTSRLNHVDISYFQQAPNQLVFKTRDFNKSITQEEFFTKDKSALIIIFGEAGSSNREISSKKQEKIISFLNKAKSHHIKSMIWINPLPKPYWQGLFSSIVKTYRFIYPCEFKQEPLLQAVEYIREKQL